MKLGKSRAQATRELGDLLLSTKVPGPPKLHHPPSMTRTRVSPAMIMQRILQPQPRSGSFFPGPGTPDQALPSLAWKFPAKLETGLQAASLYCRHTSFFTASESSPVSKRNKYVYSSNRRVVSYNLIRLTLSVPTRLAREGPFQQYYEKAIDSGY
jgi:hypothetical protein